MSEEIKAPPGHKAFTLSEPIGDPTRGVVEHVFLPLKLRAGHLKGVKLQFNVETNAVELSADSIMAVLRNCTKLDADLFDELPAFDVAMMGASLLGDLGKFLPTSMTSSATSPGSSTSGPTTSKH